MSEETSPTLADDEAKFVEYGQVLVNQVELVAPSWLRGLVDSRASGSADRNDIAAALDAAAATAVNALRALLAQDIADQHVGPLQVLRDATRVPTEILSGLGVAPETRDDFAMRAFPDDVYGLVPASFADIDPSLHEPGLVWGAAKAHVHLRRRRDQPAPEPTSEHLSPPQSDNQTVRVTDVVVLSVDLMDRSKISAAFPDATFVRSPAKLVEAAASASLVLVDLGKLGDPVVLRDMQARVVAFGSHVNEDVLTAAAAAGAEAIPRSVFFRRLETGEL